MTEAVGQAEAEAWHRMCSDSPNQAETPHNCVEKVCLNRFLYFYYRAQNEFRKCLLSLFL